jgi:hypothetical protein
MDAFVSIVLISLAVGTQAGHQEIVRLETHALSVAPREAITDHKRALAIANQLGRPRLLAVLFERLGEALERDGQLQQALIEYENGLKALAGDRSLDVKSAVDSLSRSGKSFAPSGTPVPTDLYKGSLNADLAKAEADATLPVVLLLAIGNAYLHQPQLGPALNAYERALEREEIAAAPVLRAYVLANKAEVLRRRNALQEAEKRSRCINRSGIALARVGRTRASLVLSSTLIMCGRLSPLIPRLSNSASESMTDNCSGTRIGDLAKPSAPAAIAPRPRCRCKRASTTSTRVNMISGRTKAK